MTQPKKEDCLSIDDAAASLKMSRGTLYNYMNMLQAQRLRFWNDKKTYVTKVDVERIRRQKHGEQHERKEGGERE